MLRPLTALNICLLTSLLNGEEVIFGPRQSTIEVHVPKAGLLKMMGHEHTIRASDFTAVLLMDSGDPQSVHLTIPVRDLVVTDSHLDEETREAVRATMRSEQVLSGEEYPLIQYEAHSIKIIREGLWNLMGRLSIAGQTIEIPLELEVFRNASDQFRASGVVELALQDFGIQPVSAMGGMIRTGKTVTVSFEFTSELSKRNQS